jgi:glycosyltransferase involved in cell wall biosynthesis
MNFSIATPSFNHSAWLRLCVASVADQEGVAVEHIVQDGDSTDGTLDWLPADPRVQAFVEKDEGMYDAINRGWNRATGEILAYLNCDEQYLPGALRAVQEVFQTQPEAEVVLADTVVVDPAGEYVCHRYALRPLAWHLWVRFAVLTCSVFVRRSVLDRGIHFDPRWRALGDLFWLKELLRQQVRFVVLRRFTSVFTETGGNLALSPGALRERELKQAMAPAWLRWLTPVIVGHHRWRLWRSGAFSQKPFAYSLYTLASPERRVSRFAAKPTPIWKQRR